MYELGYHNMLLKQAVGKRNIFRSGFGRARSPNLSDFKSLLCWHIFKLLSDTDEASFCLHVYVVA